MLALAGARLLNALALGDDLARGLGRRTAVDRLVVGLAVVLLAGGATALAGPIAFVGLVVPHGVRAVVGSDYRRVLPLSVGSAPCWSCSPTPSAGSCCRRPRCRSAIMTAVVGVPVFLVLVRRGRMGAL